jgi:hypothetical protein
MNKIAIFVEGQTELIFADRLVRELAHGSGLAIEHAEAIGGASGARRVRVFKHAAQIDCRRIYLLIVNCCGDANVKSDIRDRYQGLVQEGYTAIFGLRDVYGTFTHQQVPKLRAFLNLNIPTEPIAVHLILAIMEIEAWFLAEYTHFMKIDDTLTPDLIRRRVGFDPERDNLELRQHPSEDLNRVYRLTGHVYTKRRKHVQRTVDLLDYNFMRRNVAQRFGDLAAFIDGLSPIFDMAAAGHSQS